MYLQLQTPETHVSLGAIPASPDSSVRWSLVIMTIGTGEETEAYSRAMANQDVKP